MGTAVTELATALPVGRVMTVLSVHASPTAPDTVCATTVPATALRDGEEPTALSVSSAPTTVPVTVAVRTSHVLVMMVGWVMTVLSRLV